MTSRPAGVFTKLLRLGDIMHWEHSDFWGYVALRAILSLYLDQTISVLLLSLLKCTWKHLLLVVVAKNQQKISFVIYHSVISAVQSSNSREG